MPFATSAPVCQPPASETQVLLAIHRSSFGRVLLPLINCSYFQTHQACGHVQVVKALQSLLSKAAAATSPSPPIQASPIAHAGPVQSRQHSLFQQRSQWAPIASALDPAHFAAELTLRHSAPAHSLTQAADRYEYPSMAASACDCTYPICKLVLASATGELWLGLMTYMDHPRGL